LNFNSICSLAYSSVEKHKEAVDCFKKALELEPDNESYKSNLQLAQEKVKAVPQGESCSTVGSIVS
jgi:tetratricopeptide (TPR) repeat protein